MHASRFPALISSSPASSASSSRSPGLRRAALALAVVALATPWLAQAQSTQGPVRVGVVGPFTGPSADFGVPMLNGIKLAVDEINAVGGYMGRPMELVVKDDMADPARGRQAAQELLSEKVSAVLGFCNTGVALKALDLFQ